MIFFSDSGGALTLSIAGFIDADESAAAAQALAGYSGETGKKARSLAVHVASLGGDVNGGFQIRAALEDFAKNAAVPVSVYAEGVVASAAVLPFTVPGVKNIAKTGAAIFVHRAQTVAVGNAGEMQTAREGLTLIDDQIADALAARTGRDRAAILDLMRGNSWISAADAKSLGIFDEIAERSSENTSASENAEKGAKNANTAAPVAASVLWRFNALASAPVTASAAQVAASEKKPAADDIGEALKAIGARLDALESAASAKTNHIEFFDNFAPAPKAQETPVAAPAANEKYNAAAREIRF